MLQPNTVLSPKAYRKALLAERGVTAATVAAEVPCSEEMARRVFNDDFKYREADKVKRIMEIAASQANKNPDLAAVSVEELWPAKDGNGNPTQESGNGGGPE
jgi:hypothetical protein